MTDILRIENLKTYFRRDEKLFIFKNRYVYALDGVSFTLRKGEILGIIGETGSGKTTLAKTIVRIHRPFSGKIHYHDIDLSRASRDVIRQARRTMQLIYQNPLSSLNPKQRIGELVKEPLLAHRIFSGSKLEQEVRSTLAKVGMEESVLSRFPHEFSDGQKQRIAISRALVLKPEILICDEPVSALDVSIKLQILSLLKDLNQKISLTLVILSHDILSVRSICHQVMVLYLGKLVETATKDQIFNRPLHPYSEALLSTFKGSYLISEQLKWSGKGGASIELKNEIPSAQDPPPGCRFHTRCPIMTQRCVAEEPLLKEIEKRHFAACHFAKPFPISSTISVLRK